MLDYVVIALAITIFAVALANRRHGNARRNGRARTVHLDVTSESIERHLGDGRVERAHWAAVRSVEVVCTPVKTADGASAFALLGEAEDAGCLVPLGVGLESKALVELSRLPGFRLERLTEAQSLKAPARTMVWQRSDV